MSAQPIEAVLLDMGGVLIPEISDYTPVSREPELLAELTTLGCRDPGRAVEDAGRRLREAYRALETELSQPDPDVVLEALPEPIRARILDAFRREETRPPLPHVQDVVVELAHHFRLGIVSNTVIPGDHHADALERAGLLTHFDASVWSANFGRRKPDPSIVLHVLERLSTPADRAVLVGDKIRTDIAAARRSGVRGVWLRTDAARHTGEAEPEAVIRDLRELPGLLASWNSARGEPRAG